MAWLVAGRQGGLSGRSGKRAGPAGGLVALPEKSQTIQVFSKKKSFD
jgi:hypothetical protein